MNKIMWVDYWMIYRVGFGSLKTKNTDLFFMGSFGCFSLIRRTPSVAQLTPLCCSPLCGPAPSSSVVSCGSRAGERLRGRGGVIINAFYTE